MKSIVLTVVVVFAFLGVAAQGTYFNYLDSTVVWKQRGEGVGVSQYHTMYFDGDTLINGFYYYKWYRLTVESTMNWQYVWETDTALYGPGFIRENSALQFIVFNPNSGLDEVRSDFGVMNQLNVGDDFPSGVANCSIQMIDTVLLDDLQLRHYHGHEPLEPNSFLEGVGTIGGICATGVEYRLYTACVEKQGHEVSFGPADCDAFLEPVRVNTFTNISVGLPDEAYSESTVLFPNPTVDGKVVIRNEQLKKVDVFNPFGQLVCEGNSNLIDLSSFPRGVYLIRVTYRDGTMGSAKIVYQY